LNTEVRLTVRLASPTDLAFVHQDGHLPPEVVGHKIEAQAVLIAEHVGQPVGYLRLEYLWSSVPYIALIRVLPDHRRRGVGRALLTDLEDRLRAQGHKALYSSSQADEPEPQAWHRHMGFHECGFIAGLNGNGVGEVFFRKAL
jgi:N-acetylglutamate synthase-like GNAT family acetyltransferase